MTANICKKCGREMSDNKKLCHNCRNKHNDKINKIGKRIVTGVGVVALSVNALAKLLNKSMSK